MLKNYFKSLYQRTMRQAYTLARQEIFSSLKSGGKCLDCGASVGGMYDLINEELAMEKELYYGIEWNANLAKQGRSKGLNIIQGGLNKKMSFGDNTFTCIYGLSLLEHLLNPCHFQGYRIKITQ